MEQNTYPIVIPPAPKSVRGYSSSLDVSENYLLYFNGNSVILRHLKATHISVILNHVSDVTAAKFSHDGKLVASIDIKGTLIISQPCPDRIIVVYKYQAIFPNAKSIDWSADKKKVCIAGEGKNKFAKVVSIDTGITAGEIDSITATINSCSFRPQRPYKLVMAGDQYTVKCFEGPPYNFVKSDKSHTGFINSIKYSPKGTYFLTGGADRKLVLYDGKSFQKIGQRQNAHNGGVFGLDWISQYHFVTVSSDKLIKFWDIKFQQKFAIETTFPDEMKNPKKIGPFLVAVRAFNNLIYAVNLDGDILIYGNPFENNNQAIIQRYSGPRTKVIKCIPFGNNKLFLLDSGGRVLISDMEKKIVTTCATQIQMNGIVDGFLQNESGLITLFILTNNGITWIYKGTQPSNLQLKTKIDSIEFKEISTYKDSKHFLGVSNNKLVLYDILTQKIVKQSAIQEDITCLSSNNSFILIGTIRGNILTYNINLQPIKKINLNTFKISTISLLTSSQPSLINCIIGDTCGNMTLIQLSEVGIKPVKETMGGHNSVITGADSDGKFIYTFSMDGKVSIWDKKSLQRINEIKDIVNGGIIHGISIGKKLVLTGGDLVTKIINKVA